MITMTGCLLKKYLFFKGFFVGKSPFCEERTFFEELFLSFFLVFEGQVFEGLP